MKAFTLFEMLVSVGVLLILAGLVVSIPASAPQNFDLLNSAQRIEAELRKVQGYAVASKNFTNSPPAGGWGIHFQVGQRCYIIFGDIGASPNEQYDPMGVEQRDICNSSKNDPASERNERIYLPATISVASIVPAGVHNLGLWGPGDALDVVYQPPLLKVFFNNTSIDSAQVVVQSRVGATKTITINSVGNVTIQ